MCLTILILIQPVLSTSLLQFLCYLIVHFFSLLFSDARRALELLQQYRAKLDQRQQNQNRTKQGPVEEDQQLQQSLDRVISVFQSQLFSALLGKSCCLSHSVPGLMLSGLNWQLMLHFADIFEIITKQSIVLTLVGLKFI